MTEKELQQLKRAIPDGFPKVEEETKTDEYGVYSTGLFLYKGKQILVQSHGGMWHLSVSAKHPLGYAEIKEVRYKFMPDNMEVAQIFPSRKEFVNIHPNCYHLFQLAPAESEQPKPKTTAKSKTKLSTPKK